VEISAASSHKEILVELVWSRISDQPDVGEFVAVRAVVGEEKYWARITPLRSTSRICSLIISSYLAYKLWQRILFVFHTKSVNNTFSHGL